MAPASRPACSCSPPSAAVTVVALFSREDRGRAPYDSMLARLWASSCLKLPEISAWPPVMACCTNGLETTSPSRTMPNSFCGRWFLASSAVMFANFLAPLEVKFIWTCQPAAPCVSKTAWAFLTSVPSTAAGPSRYLNQTLSVWPQATVDSPGLAALPAVARWAGLAQSRLVYSACSLAAVASTPLLDEAEGLAEDDAFAEAEDDGVASAFSASVTARPCEVAVAVGEAEEDEDAFSFEVALVDGLGDPLEPALDDALGEGLVAAEVLASLARTGRKYSFAVVPTCWRASSELVPLGMLTMMLLVPWVCTSASETPRPLTRRFMMSTAVSMLALLIADPWSAFASSVMLVPPARSMPRRGVGCPEANMPPVSATMAIRMRASERPGLLWALALRPLLGAATFSYSLSGRPAPGRRGRP